MKVLRFGLAVVGFVSLPLTVHAQNNTPATASKILVGHEFNVFIDTVAPNDLRWYQFHAVATRSYCVEAGVDHTLSPTLNLNDDRAEVFRADGTTVIVNGDDAAGEPGGGQGFGPSRGCYIAPATEQNLIRIDTFESSAHTLHVKTINTTLFSPWFFSGGGYEAFILMKNTTNSGITATVTLFTTGGAVQGPPQTAVVPANGSFNLQVSAAPPTGFGLASATGSVQIAHNGAPGALVANVTSLNFTAGVSFDTTAGPRPDWQH
jgi:hypothetical protein